MWDHIYIYILNFIFLEEGVIEPVNENHHSVGEHIDYDANWSEEHNLLIILIHMICVWGVRVNWAMKGQMSATKRGPNVKKESVSPMANMSP
jgi:hypothetical protein